MILFSLVLGIFFMNQYSVIRTIGMILGVFQLFLLMILDGEMIGVEFLFIEHFIV